MAVIIRVKNKQYYERKKTKKLKTNLLYGGTIMSTVVNYSELVNEAKPEVKHVIVNGVIMTYEEWLDMRKAELN